MKPKNNIINVNDVKDCLNVPLDITSCSVNITPEQAKFILKNCNKGNRRTNKSYVETLRRDMENNRWYNDTSYIGFDRNGRLVNGQHRLKALSEANVKFITLKIDFNCEQHISMDTGINRTYAATASIAKKNGISLLPLNFKPIITSALRLNNIKNNAEDKIIKPSNSELEEYWKKYCNDLEICQNNKLFDLGKINSSFVKASIFAAYKSNVNLDILIHFSEVLRTGIAKSDYDIPIIRLRDELIDMKGSSGNATELRRAQYTQYAIYAISELKSTSNRLPATNRLQLYYEI